MKSMLGSLACALVLMGSQQPAGAQSGCDELIQTFNGAIDRAALEQAKTIEATIATSADCGMKLQDVQRRRAAFQLLLVSEKMKTGASASDYEGLLVDADKPAVLWRAAVALGDLRFGQRDFREATLAYERAIEIMKNPAKTPQSPDLQTIAAIVDRTSQARALAANAEGNPKAEYVTAAKDHRDGKVGGSMSKDIRGFKPVSIPIPIGFETATAKFTQIGERAAKELADVLREQGPTEVVLIGHTDERGESEYNMRLSAQRVAAVASYLKQNGVSAKISTIARGKSEPLQISNATDLSREDIWALNRRVVWKRD